jgi:alpha-L-fucosidase 2
MTLQPGNNEWAVWPMGGTWLCQSLWEHYAFSGDTNFLATRAYPLLKGAAAFAQDLLVDDGSGHLLHAPSTSPENRFQTANGDVLAVCMGSTIDLALTRQLFQNCIQAAHILNVDSNLSAKLQSDLDRLMPFQISTNLPG